MSDTIDAAPAAAEQSSAPVDPAAVSTPNPVEGDIPVKEPVEKAAKLEPKDEAKPERSASVREALKKADADLRAKSDKADPKALKDAPEKTAEPKDKTKPVDAEAPKRGDDGKFTPKEPAQAAGKPATAQEPQKEADTPDKAAQTLREAPKRFDDAAKAEWEKAPEAVRGATQRVIRELESGIEKYRADYEPIKAYNDLAKQHGTSIKDALDRYTGLEKMLGSQNQQEKLAGIQQVFDYAGINLREFAAHIAGQTPEQGAAQQEATLRELRQEIAGLKQQLGGVSTNMQQRQEQEVLTQIQQFAADKPRFDEIAEDIAFFLQSGKAQSLQDAYELAERLNPAPATAIAPAQTRSDPITPEAQTLKGSKSVSGAPSAGASPAKAQSSSSIKEALKRAAAQVS